MMYSSTILFVTALVVVYSIYYRCGCGILSANVLFYLALLYGCIFNYK